LYAYCAVVCSYPTKISDYVSERVDPDWVEIPSWLTLLHDLCLHEKNKANQLVFLTWVMTPK